MSKSYIPSWLLHNKSSVVIVAHVSSGREQEIRSELSGEREKEEEEK